MRRKHIKLSQKDNDLLSNPWIDVRLVFIFENERRLAIDDDENFLLIEDSDLESDDFDYFWKITFPDPNFPNMFWISIQNTSVKTKCLFENFHILTLSDVSDNNYSPAMFTLDSDSEHFMIKNHEGKWLGISELNGCIVLEEICFQSIKLVKFLEIEFYIQKDSENKSLIKKVQKRMEKAIFEGNLSVISDIYLPD